MFSTFRKDSNKQPLARISQPSKRINPSISFSISYVRVCEWAKNPEEHSRPLIETLNQAAEHATKLGDAYILQKIEDAKAEWFLVDKTVTPKSFPSGKHKVEKSEPSGPNKPPKIVEEQSKKIAVFSSTNGSYHTPTKSVSKKETKEPIDNILPRKRNATSPYSLRPNKEEVIKIKDENFFEQALASILDKIEHKQ